MKKKLLIVESVHKSKSIQAFLGPDWIVKASIGHIRELTPTKQIPEDKKSRFSPYSVDTSTFDLLFSVSSDRKKVVSELKKLAKTVDEIYWGTDPDREGTAIAWHLKEELNPKVPNYRVSWQEVTKKAVLEGIKDRSEINQNEVDASMSRLTYDRLFGFAISGNVQRAIREKSAGRVQSPALRIIVDRERERLAFSSAQYLSLTGDFMISGSVTLSAKLVALNDRKIATGASFNSSGKLDGDEYVLTNENVTKVRAFLERNEFEVSDISTKKYSRKPNIPYTTSSFQQDVGNRLRLSSKQIMSVAQRLFDAGYISYMRTDSPHLGDEALQAAFSEASRLFPKETPSKPTIYKAKGQGGHEAIRPVCDDSGNFRPPSSVKSEIEKLDKNAFRVYEAIYNRTVASQMNPAAGFTTTVKILGKYEDKTSTFSAAATTYTSLGWMSLVRPTEDDETANAISSKIEKNEQAELKGLTTKEHKTTPPSRYTEPQLVAKLEELGIGRPSTYASIVTVNQARGYVKKKGGQLFPTWQGMKVAQYLEAKIPTFVSHEATAKMEEELDLIESGELKRGAFLKQEWKKITEDVLSLNSNIDWDEINKITTIDLNNGYLIRVNGYGAFLESSSDPLDENNRREGVRLEDNQNVAEFDFSDKSICKEIHETAKEPSSSRELGVLSSGAYEGWVVTARTGKFGNYVQAVPPKQDAESKKKPPKPVNQTLGEDQDFNTVTLEDISEMFNEVKLPRWSSDGKWLIGVGKKGPYVGKKASKTAKPQFRSLGQDIDPRKITFKAAQEIWENGSK